HRAGRPRGRRRRRRLDDPARRAAHDGEALMTDDFESVVAPFTTDSGAGPEDVAFDAALRPRSIDELIGQDRVREQLALVIEAAQARGRTPDHVLLSGPPGLGKTTLAMIIAHQLNAPLRITSGPAIQNAGDLAAIPPGINE